MTRAEYKDSTDVLLYTRAAFLLQATEGYSDV